MGSVEVVSITGVVEVKRDANENTFSTNLTCVEDQMTYTNL